MEAAMIAKTKKPAKQDKAGLACSFCGKSNKEVPSLLAAGARPGVYICGLCVGACNQVLAGVPTEGPADWTKRSDDELLVNLPRTQSVHHSTAVVLQQQIDELRKREVSWQKIGDALGVSRQAAWERFG
jgi:hypothetical protein